MELEQICADFTLKVGGMITLIILAFIAGNTLKNVKLNEFGDDKPSKMKVAMKLVANIFIFLCLELILIAGIFRLFNDQVVLLLFVSGLAALGVKLVSDLK
ncbi:MAG: hypothetical protein HYR67_16725 [Bacteroidetes bacterium]|nr:hypothetical protein [Bacteroidota bacterium]